jgi:hypothetical protein
MKRREQVARWPRPKIYVLDLTSGCAQAQSARVSPIGWTSTMLARAGLGVRANQGGQRDQ